MSADDVKAQRRRKTKKWRDDIRTFVRGHPEIFDPIRDLARQRAKENSSCNERTGAADIAAPDTSPTVATSKGAKV
jgi:hypothetical protein